MEASYIVISLVPCSAVEYHLLLDHIPSLTSSNMRSLHHPTVLDRNSDCLFRYFTIVFSSSMAASRRTFGFNSEFRNINRNSSVVSLEAWSVDADIFCATPVKTWKLKSSKLKSEL